MDIYHIDFDPLLLYAEEKLMNLIDLYHKHNKHKKINHLTHETHFNIENTPEEPMLITEVIATVAPIITPLVVAGAALATMDTDYIVFFILSYIINQHMDLSQNIDPAIDYVERKVLTLIEAHEKKRKDKLERMINFKNKIKGEAKTIVCKVEDMIIDEAEEMVAKVEEMVAKVEAVIIDETAIIVASVEDTVAIVEDAILDVAPIIFKTVIEPILMTQVQMLLAPVVLVAPVLAPVFVTAEQELERKLNIQLQELINRSRKKKFRK